MPEWLESDGLGGFASGTVSGVRTRTYQALLLAATTPPSGRMVLVNGLDASIELNGGSQALSSQAYPGDVVHPDGARRLESFQAEPWPTWTYRLRGGLRVVLELFVPKGRPVVCLSWRVVGRPEQATLTVRPFLSGRDFHCLHHENGAFNFATRRNADRVTWTPYPQVPSIICASNGAFTEDPLWYRRFTYAEERERGLDFEEDLAAPGVLRFDLAHRPAVMVLAAAVSGSELEDGLSAEELFSGFQHRERERRKAFATGLHRSADAYLVQRGAGQTVIAGYPWFGDWGRDTFISLRGLCIAAGRLADARGILLEWAASISQGMLPNRFPDRGDTPEFNSVDASLWFAIAVHDYLTAAGPNADAADVEALDGAVEAILTGYARGTRHGIRADSDGLLQAGEPGWQLTWMDAKVGDWVVTPRIGKPVEVQALWLNALWTASQRGGEEAERWARLWEKGQRAFEARFWNPERHCLYDVVDVDHRPGATDARVRPNQIFAVGGLPRSLLSADKARAVVDCVEARLWTPMGLRTLAPGEPGYVARYQGAVLERDGAYHQGTVWPWLIGPFVDAFVRVRADAAGAKEEARRRFVTPLLAYAQSDGLGHLPEIADAEPPHAPRGCPFQAWSLAELLWITS